MPRKGPGKSHRKTIGILDLFALFPDEKSAINWFESVIWKNGRTCPKCGKSNTYKVKGNANGMPYRCRDCMRYFSVKTGTAMASSKLPLRTWVIALYLEMSSLTGVSSMKLHRNLGISQCTAWYLLHKIRTGFPEASRDAFQSAVEVDEMYLGGKEKKQAQGQEAECGARNRREDDCRGSEGSQEQADTREGGGEYQ